MKSNKVILQKVHLTEEKETLLIPLFAKALDNRRKDPILGDETADQLAGRIDYDFQKLGDFGGSGLMVIRAKQLDEWIKDFISKHQNAIVLNLGCGLDPRILRINPPSNISWYDIDFPDVIELRKKFFTEKNNYCMIGSSVTDQQWLDKIPEDRPVIAVAEGLLEYLTESDVKTLFNRVTEHFSQGQIAFDVLNSFAIRQGNSKMKKTTGAILRWAVDDVREIEQLDPKLKKITEQPLVGVFWIRKLPWNDRMLYGFINLFPLFRKMLFRLYRFRFETPPKNKPWNCYHITMNLSPEEKNRTVISTRVIDAPVDEVFDAYANPEKIVRWWGPTGFTLTNESIDLKEGGHWHFVFTSPDGKEFRNHLIFTSIKRPSLFVVDHLSGPRYHGAVTFDDVNGKTRVTMYWTFENAEVYARIKDTVVAGNEGNFDRLSEVIAGRR